MSLAYGGTGDCFKRQGGLAVDFFGSEAGRRDSFAFRGLGAV